MARFARNGRARVAIATATAPVRCATYCRVSTEAQADKEFNSVEAQRQACETYVGLHREDGWIIAPEPYLDPGFTGSNTNRPGLQRLIADIEAGKIDVVVVYKYDRLSRSMLDFLQLLEFFKRHGVSFVSVSQRFDTSTPVGEMTLNILLSFAQFERQIIAERTRDKMAAARRRGRWTGGMPPLGYDIAPEGGRLVMNREEAEEVRAIFELYAENPSLLAVAQELNRRGLRRKSWDTRDGKRREGKPWDRVNLRHVLTNPLYVGRMTLHGETFDGEHAGVVPRAIFEKVQRLLAGNRSNRGASRRNQYGALLRGLLRCSSCDTVMAHAPVRKDGKLYRYYRCTHSIRNGATSCPSRSISADRVEAFVVGEIRRIGADPELQRATFEQAVAQVKAQRRGLMVERRRLDRDLATAKGDIERLVGAVSRVTGPAADAIAAELARAQERLARLEARQREVQDELAALAATEIDPDAVARALENFEELWSVLLTPERERILRLLIERVSYDGSTGRLEIGWRLAGLGEFTREVDGG